MSNLKNKNVKMILALVLVFILIFNIITTKSYSATLDITSESTVIDGDFKFNYNLGFQDIMITSDFVLEFDSKYIEFLGTDTENVEYNQIENGKIIFLYVDENGNGTQNININFKLKYFEEKFSTQIKITDINAYSLIKGEAYSSKDYDLDKTIMTILSNGKEEVNPDTNTSENIPNEDDSNIGDITNTSNDNTLSNDSNINIDNVGAVTNNNVNNDTNNSTNNSTIKISTPNEDSKAVGALPFAGKTTSIIAIILLIILIGHSGISWVKYHRKETNIFMMFIIALILYGSVDSNAAGNIFIQNFDRIKNFEHLIVIIPDLENRNIKYSDFIFAEKSNNLNIVQTRNKKGEVLDLDDYISTGDIAQSNEKIGYKIVVYGDVNSDGNVNSNDIAEILVHKLNNVELDALSKKAANLCNEDDIEDKTIDSTDIEVIKQYVLRTIEGNLVQRLPEELAKGIKIIADKTEMNIDEEQKLSFLVEPEEIVVNDIEWSTSDENIATISEEGLLIAKSNGVVYITAMSKSDTSLNDTITIEVISPVTGVKLTHNKLELEVGETRVVGAMVEPVEAKHREVIWSTSNSQIASVDANGKITALEEGKVVITATTEEGKFTDTCEVTIIEEEVITPPKDLYVREVVINKTYTVLERGEKEKLEAFVVPASALDQSVYWETSDSNIVTVTQNGEIEAISSGMAVITAVSNDGGYTASCVVIVDKTDVTSISLNETKINITKGEDANLIATITPSNATNKEVIWSSSNELVATVNDGKVIGVGTGIATITAKTKDGGYVAICMVQVAPIYPSEIRLDKEEISIYVGKTSKLNATVLPENADNQNVIWESNNENVCTVDNFGNITAIKKGNAIITAKTEEGNKTATCRVNVDEEINQVTGVTLNKTTLTLDEGITETLVATVLPENANNKNVTWKSSNESIASVDVNGKVTAKSAGTATITVTTADGNKTATCIVTVNRVIVQVTGIRINKSTLTLDEGITETLVATVLPENADNKNVTWKSSNESIATVDVNGKVTAQSAGTATITVTTADGNRAATCIVTVKRVEVHVSGVSLNKTTLSLDKNKSETLIATVTPANADNKTVMWESNDESIATVNENGEVVGKNAGTTTITVITEDGNKTATCSVTVRPIQATGIKINKNSTELYIGNSETLVATIEPEDADNKTVVWDSSDSNIVSVSSGEITGKSEGTATIFARTPDGEFSAECIVTVTERPIRPEEVKLNRTNDTLDMSGEKQGKLNATIYPENCNTDTDLTWSSSNKNIVIVSEDGTITGVSNGEADIIVKTQNNKTATCHVIVVTTPQKVSLNKTIINLSLYNNNTEQLIAKIEPETANVDNNIAYSSENESIATVDRNGLITAHKEGTTQINVTTENGKTASCEVNVSAPIIEPEISVTLSEDNIELEVGEKKELEILIKSDEFISSKACEYTNNNATVLKVERSELEKYEIEGLKSGETTIDFKVKVNDKEFNLSCNVKVKPSSTQPPEETIVSLSSNDMNLQVGEEKYLDILVTPAQAYKAGIVHSDIVDAESAGGKFKLIGKKAGTYNMKVTVTTTDDGKEYVLYCRVTVTENGISRSNVFSENNENILDENETKSIKNSILQLLRLYKTD